MNHDLVCAATCCLLALSFSANADNSLENITVTASRTPTLINDAGSAISLITRQDIERQSATSLADLLRNVPGLAVSQQGGIGTFAQVRMRGAEANQVLVLIDGVEANDIGQGSEFNFTHVLASDIQRIEVVRGPQSALWGADALAGVVNVITEPGAQAANGISASAGAGSHNAENAAVDYNFSNDFGRFSVGASQYGTAGTNISRTGGERDGYRNTTAHIDGHIELSDATHLSAMFRGTNASTDFDGIDLVAIGLPVDAPFVTDARQRYAKISLDSRLTPGIQQLVSLTRSSTANVNKTDAIQNDVTDGAKNSLHLQTNIALGANTLSLVLEHEATYFRQRGAASFYGDPNKDLSSNTNSFAAEVHHQGKLFDLSASARHDNNSEFRNADTWRTTGLWHVTPATGLYVSAGRGIKNPTFTERFGYYNTFKGNPDLRPEDSLGWEVGLRESQPIPGLDFSASYFQSRLENEINGFVFDATSGLFTAENISNASHRKGIELEAEWELGEDTNLHGSYTWLIASQPGPSGDQAEVRRPRNSASIRVNHSIGHLNLNAGAEYTGATVDDFFPPYPPYQERVPLQPYTLINVAAAYQVTPNVSITARVDNLFNKTYEEVYGFRAPGIGAYAGVRVSM